MLKRRRGRYPVRRAPVVDRSAIWRPRSAGCARSWPARKKVERIYQTRYETRAQARLDIVDWIEGYYNRQRMHTSIDYCTPVEYETLRAAA
ncbi:IS3 family transposase [Burkholderia ambifaria]|uniref:IS3 family transposase n=1 Tax=Burkholderia ambifaria TaxID=152480 RepID=UPI000A2F7AE4